MRSVAGKARRKIRIGTVDPATIGVLPAFLARIGRKYPDIELHVSRGSTNDIIRGLENGQINLGFIRPVENIGSLRFISIAYERYLLAVEKNSALLARSEIGIEDLKGEKIISFSRQNLSYTERYFAEKFGEHDLSKSVAYTCDDTFSLVSLVSAGLCIGFAPEWTLDLPIRNFELRKGRRLQDRARGCVVQGRSDGSPRRDHQYRPVAGQGRQLRRVEQRRSVRLQTLHQRHLAWKRSEDRGVWVASERGLKDGTCRRRYVAGKCCTTSIRSGLPSAAVERKCRLAVLEGEDHVGRNVALEVRNYLSLLPSG
ncbi:hypothetical protein BLJAPNOD_05169 [Ensifer sp. M14]|nr:hypothetical protein BLJAPNOD_05169 [Ensifer sp. M14]